MKSSSETLEESVVAWAFGASEIINRMEIYKKRYKVIQYEKLVTKPKELMKEIADFIGCAMDPSMMYPSFNGKPWKGNSVFGEKKGLEMTIQKHISDRDVGYIQKGLSDYMNKLGYKEI